MFKGYLATTEFIAKHIYYEMKKKLDSFSGTNSVTLGEIYDAWASFEVE